MLGILKSPLFIIFASSKCVFMTYSWNIIGHERQLKRLECDLSSLNPSHAYLFHGPSSLGKSTVAHFFSMALLCANGLCFKCDDCRRLEGGFHPDFISFKDGGTTLKIDEIRELSRKVNLTSQGRRRVVFIENIERMPVEAQNAFLKTLEEPPEATFFVLTSSHVSNVLPTIVSRVQDMEFMPISNSILASYLHSYLKDAYKLDSIVTFAQGRPGLALRLLHEPQLFSDYHQLAVQIHRFLSQNDVLSKFAYAEVLDKDSLALDRFFDVFSLVLSQSLRGVAPLNAIAFENRYELRQIIELFEKLFETRYLTASNVNKRLCLENFLLMTEV